MASPVIVDVAGAVPILEPGPSSDSGSSAGDDGMPPIMQFMYFHKAIRAELEQLHSDALRFERERGKEMEGLIRRYQFLRSVYEHHSSAEDEVILPALDARVKNVAHSYSLEHQVESNLFQHLFEVLNMVREAEEDALEETLRNVVCSTKALLTTLSQHLSKEEEQVFPLLVKHFSRDEQAALVWQFLCSIPVNLMESFLPWLASSLSVEDREQMIVCMRKIVPGERLLQQVVFGWLKRSNISDTRYEDAFVEFPALRESKHPPINELLSWHKAIRKEMEHLAEEAKVLKSSSPSTLSSFIDRLRFLIEVCVFHSAAEDKILFPAVDQKAKTSVSFTAEHVHESRDLEMVQRLTDEISSMGHVDDKAEELCSVAEHVMQTLQKHFIEEEVKVIPLVQEYFTVDEQRILLYHCLRVMPLRLLERVIPWFVELLSDEEAKDMLQNMSRAAPVADKHLVALLSGWACTGRPKSATFKCLYSCEECPVKKLASGDPKSLKPADEKSAPRSKRPREDAEATLAKNSVSKQCCVPGLGVKCSSLGITRARKPASSSSPGPGCSSVFGVEKPGTTTPAPKPIDHIFQFHKAIRNDLEYLDLESAKLGSCDESFLRQFSGRFHFLWGLYRAHSNAEDDIVFPALEAKEALHNVSHSYSLDHKQEEFLFEEIAGVLREMTQLFGPESQPSGRRVEFAQRLQGMCKSVRCSLDHHVAREEHELWPLFDIHFSIEEQDRIVGRIVGTTGAEVLQSMIPWVTASLSEDEQNLMMDSWKQATKNTMFDQWLSAWWENGSPKATSSSSSPPVDGSQEPSTPPSGTSESLQLVAEYLASSGIKPDVNGGVVECVEGSGAAADDQCSGEECKGCDQNEEVEDCCLRREEKNKQVVVEAAAAAADTGKFKPGWQDIFRMNQKELEGAIRRVSNDSSLDPRRKAYLIQNLMTSRWIASQQHSTPEPDSSEDIPGRSRSFNDSTRGIYGCEHYKRNCKVRASCCGSLFTCRFCHDKNSDHPMDRHATKEMMCMQCLEVQPVAESCSTPQCNGFRMAKYYCGICRFFDDDNKDIYHCPFCNLCRRGKGLGIDYFHCMTCNACMNVSLKNHKCREKGLESNCPICHDFLFTSSSPVKALPCNHFMHSDCFQAYTCCHYTCPICCKSLGDMSVYFGMLDALLAAEQLPDDYKGRVQDILCNDCEQKGTAPYHWLYHKCSHCGSYNTRTIYDASHS